MREPRLVGSKAGAGLHGPEDGPDDEAGEDEPEHPRHSTEEQDSEDYLAHDGLPVGVAHVAEDDDAEADGEPDEEPSQEDAAAAAGEEVPFLAVAGLGLGDRGELGVALCQELRVSGLHVLDPLDSLVGAADAQRRAGYASGSGAESHGPCESAVPHVFDGSGGAVGVRAERGAGVRGSGVPLADGGHETPMVREMGCRGCGSPGPSPARVFGNRTVRAGPEHPSREGQPQPMRRTLTTIAWLAGIYALAAWLAGPTQLAHAFIKLTAIDQWHPNWPSSATVDAAATALSTVAAILAITLFALLMIFRPRNRYAGPPAPAGAAAIAASTGSTAFALQSRTPTRQQFHAELCHSLTGAGIPDAQALEAVDAAMALADSDDPRDWAGRVRREAVKLAGLDGTFIRVQSREASLSETARFLTSYGYPTLRVTQVGTPRQGDGHESEVVNFDGLAVQHRTDAHHAEGALIELLIIAHQAHMASMADNGAPDQSGKVERAAKGLRNVATKLALRGFVPPELDAQIGRDGIATADELEQWAIAQVVAACSPMTNAPLPTTERLTTEGSGA